MLLMPSSAAEEGASFFRDYAEAPRAVLDVRQIIAHPLEPEHAPDPEPQPEPPTATPPVARSLKRDDRMAALQAALGRDRGQGAIVLRDAALAEWRTIGIQPGKGNAAFFQLAYRLAKAGMDAADLRTTLGQEAALANSPADRRKEIGPIMNRLGRQGLI